MKNVIQQLRKTVFKKTNFKAFFFFLFFSIIIWILVQFSKNYRQDITINVEYINLPKDKIVKKTNDKFPVRLSDNGFNIAWYGIVKPSITLSLEELPVYKDNLVYIVKNHKDILQEQLDVDINEITFLKDTLAIPFVQKKVKKIPIKPKIDISFAPGYASNKPLVIQPDSIKVSGAAHVIDSLEYVNTKTISLKNVQDNIAGEIDLDTAKIKEVTFYRSKVSYKQNVEKFTEGRVQVPIQIINAPKNLNLSIFPKEVVVIYVVSLENYKTISKENFKVVCDYKELKEDQNFFIPKLVKKPEAITSSRLNINKVQFVIKK